MQNLSFLNVKTCIIKVVKWTLHKVNWPNMDIGLCLLGKRILKLTKNIAEQCVAICSKLIKTALKQGLTFPMSLFLTLGKFNIFITQNLEFLFQYFFGKCEQVNCKLFIYSP